MLTHFDAFYQRFERLESEYEALREGVARLEAAVGSGDARVPLRLQLQELKDKVAELQRRIEELESSAS